MIAYLTRAWLGTLWSGMIAGTRIVLVLSRPFVIVLLISADGRHAYYAKRAWRRSADARRAPTWILEILWDL